MIKFIFIFACMTCTNLFAEDTNENRPHHGPKFSSEQEACLTSILGERGKGERPTKEKMEAAFSKCGIEKPAARPGEHLDHQENQNQ